MIRVFAAPSRKCEFCPCFDFVRAGDLFLPVCRPCVDRRDFLGFVCSHHLIEDDIGIDLKACGVKCPDSSQILVKGSVFCTDAAFLIKFSKIVQVIDVVADGRNAGSTLVGRREPDRGNSSVFQIGCAGFCLLPECPVRGEIPFKKLNNRFIFHIIKPPFEDFRNLTAMEGRLST